MHSKYSSAILVSGTLLLAACASPPETTMPTPKSDTDTQATSLPQGDVELLSGKYTVILKTSKGDMTLELDSDTAPKTVTNFVTHAKNGYYDGLTFHRVIEDFMIQGGDPEGVGSGGESIWGSDFEDEINAESYGLHEKKLVDVTDDPVPDEAKEWSLKQYYEAMGYLYRSDLQSLPMDRGAIAMANRGPNTNGSQFFIIHKEGGTPWLEGKHTVFGKIVAGLDVLDAIAGVETGAGDKPTEDITFTVEVE